MPEVKQVPLSEIIIHHNVYDVSKYLEDHPGGADALIEVAGKDSTVAFEDVGHSTIARETMESLLVGRVEGAPDDDEDNEGAHLPMPKPNVQLGDSDFHSESPTITAGRAALKLGITGSAIFWGVLLSSMATLSVAAGLGLYLEKKFGAKSKTPYSYPAHFKPSVHIAKPVTKVKGYLKPEEYQKLPLVQKDKLSSNTYRFIFKLPNEKSILGLPIGQHISIRADIEGKTISRSYTPVSNNSDPGELQLVIKCYPDGQLTRKYMQNLQVGDEVEVRGPKGAMRYGKGMVKELGMVAGGTGITPMYQLIRAICEDPTDSTHVSLVYGNNTEADILLRDKLDEFASKYPDNFSVNYVPSKPPKDWKYGTGYVTKDLVKEKFPEPSEDSKALLCGPPGLPRAVSKLPDQVFSF
ncbi:cytochrome b5 reductase-like protein [Rhexocercosporidium sp. MPI-PUGE-AT-0058]|nr:cytochrome b5 reductase-like protein [Rhexocercosporidium sp. MPI-PUGE-AT-0058]